MSVHLKVDITASCARHPRYNPTIDGDAGIKAGCLQCWKLFELYSQLQQFLVGLREEMKGLKVNDKHAERASSRSASAS
jgi:hypothetical protein